MATSTNEPIVFYTLPSTSADITISSIPDTYRDIILVINGKMTPNTAYVDISVNGSTTGYFHQIGQANGGSTSFYAEGVASNNGFFMYNDQSQVICHFFDYAQTNKYKSWLWRADNALINQMGVMSWSNTDKISSIRLFDGSGESFASGTTIALYGVHG